MLVGLLFAVVIVIVGVPALLYFWLWHSKISESKLALIYFAIVAALCVAFSISPNDPSSILSLTAFSISFVLTLPWSALAGFVITEILDARGLTLGDRLFALVLVFCAGVNALILYFIALKMRRLISSKG